MTVRALFSMGVNVLGGIYYRDSYPLVTLVTKQNKTKIPAIACPCPPWDVRLFRRQLYRAPSPFAKTTTTIRGSTRTPPMPTTPSY